MRYPVVLAAAFLAGCAAAPPEPPASEPVEAASVTVPCEAELMPEPPVESLEASLREAQGLFEQGQTEAAMLAYERILASATEPRDQLNALIALGLIRLLPSSHLRDLDAAELIFDEIDKRIGRSGLFYEYFGQLELLRQIQSYQKQLAELTQSVGDLKVELARKEDAIRKLREITVGGGLGQ